MNIEDLSSQIGMPCELLIEDAGISVIGTPYAYCDGDEFPAFAEVRGNQIRLFDDGNILIHIRSLGISLYAHGSIAELRALAEKHGLTLTAEGEFETCANPDEISSALMRYLRALRDVDDWEQEQLHAREAPLLVTTV